MRVPVQVCEGFWSRHEAHAHSIQYKRTRTVVLYVQYTSTREQQQWATAGRWMHHCSPGAPRPSAARRQVRARYVRRKQSTASSPLPSSPFPLALHTPTRAYTFSLSSRTSASITITTVSFHVPMSLPSLHFTSLLIDHSR